MVNIILYLITRAFNLNFTIFFLSIPFISYFANYTKGTNYGKKIKTL